MNICLLGISGSGKTCYLYAAAQILSTGIHVNNHTISITSQNRTQTLLLHKGIEQMAQGLWPDGSINTMNYDFDLKIDGMLQSSFTIYDYRGGMLTGLGQQDQDETDKLFETFNDAGCIIILVDGETIMTALDPSDLSPDHHNPQNTSVKQLIARNELNYIEALIADYNRKTKKNVPILLTITKSDIFYSTELQAGKELLKQLLPSVFSHHNEKISGIIAVTLGENLQNEEGKLSGTLCLNTNSNIHIPILFALYQRITELDVIKKLFSHDKIEFYVGGKRALML